MVSEPKHVFVCGLPRSGTSVLGRNVARLEDSTGFRNTGVLEDEGVFLQDVYPREYELGGPTRFGFDPRAHRTETSELLQQDKLARLRSSWDAHWDLSKSIRVEKSPGNLLMTRFLAAGFPNAYFIVVKRHPIPVVMAPQKWTVSATSLDTALRHWLHCHAIFEADRKHLHHVYELSYEDYVKDADRFHQEIAAFLGTKVREAPSGAGTIRYVAQWRKPQGLAVTDDAMEAVSDSHNKRYFEEWERRLRASPLRAYYKHLVAKYERPFRRYGYSLIEGIADPSLRTELTGATESWAGHALIHAADGYAATLRLAARTRWTCKRQLRRLVRHRRHSEAEPA